MLLLLALISPVSHAKDDLNAVGTVALSAVHSAFFSTSPEVFGGFMRLFSPIAETSEQTPKEQVFAVGSLFSIGLYNIQELSKNKYTYNEVFKKNLVLLNVNHVVNYITSKAWGKRNQEKEGRVKVVPKNDGYMLSDQSEF